MFFDFTESESSCIRSITTWEDKTVTIIFQTNADFVYYFTCDNVTQIEEFFRNRTNESVGQQYHKWIADGTLKPVEQPVAV
jgi:hypothetical protein